MPTQLERDLLLLERLASHTCDALDGVRLASTMILRIRAQAHHWLAQIRSRRDVLLPFGRDDRSKAQTGPWDRGQPGDDCMPSITLHRPSVQQDCGCLVNLVASLCRGCGERVLERVRDTPIGCSHTAAFFEAHLPCPAPFTSALTTTAAGASSPKMARRRSVVTTRKSLSPKSPRRSFGGASDTGQPLDPELADSLLSEESAPSGQGETDTASPRRRRKRYAEKPIESFGNSIKEWEIQHDELVYLEKVGSGSFGTVYKGRWHGPVAIKNLLVTNPDKAQLEAFRNEVDVLRKTRHTNVLLFMGACITLPHLAIVTRWCEGLSLYHHLHVLMTRYRPMDTLLIATQICHGMEYLHAKGIIHRDLKSNNILLTDTDEGSNHVHIADFGLATVKKNWVAGSLSGPAGSVQWMAPEIIIMLPGTNPYTVFSDVYAFGITLFEIAAGRLPYLDRPAEVIMYLVGRGHLQPDVGLCQKDLPPELLTLMSDCWAKAPRDRPPFSGIAARLDALTRITPVLRRTGSDTMLKMRRDKGAASRGNLLESDERVWTPRPLSIHRARGDVPGRPSPSRALGSWPLEADTDVSGGGAGDNDDIGESDDDEGSDGGERENGTDSGTNSVDNGAGLIVHGALVLPDTQTSQREQAVDFDDDANAAEKYNSGET